MNVGEVRSALGGNLAPIIPLHPMGAPSVNAPVLDQAPADPGMVKLPAGRWAKYAGKLGAALTVTVSAASIRSGGHEPNEPDDSDVDLLQDALEEGLRLRFGDGPVPWWLGAAMAAGGVYAAMRIGARPIPKKGAALTPDDSPTIESAPMAAPAAQRHPAGTPVFRGPPPIESVQGTGGI